MESRAVTKQRGFQRRSMCPAVEDGEGKHGEEDFLACTATQEALREDCLQVLSEPQLSSR